MPVPARTNLLMVAFAVDRCGRLLYSLSWKEILGEWAWGAFLQEARVDYRKAIVVLAVSVAFLIRAPLSFAHVPANANVASFTIKVIHQMPSSVTAFNRYEAFKLTP